MQHFVIQVSCTCGGGRRLVKKRCLIAAAGLRSSRWSTSRLDLDTDRVWILRPHVLSGDELEALEGRIKKGRYPVESFDRRPELLVHVLSQLRSKQWCRQRFSRHRLQFLRVAFRTLTKNVSIHPTLPRNVVSTQNHLFAQFLFHVHCM